MMEKNELKDALFKAAKEKFGDKILNTCVNYDIPVIEITPEIHRDFARWLKENPEFEFNHFIDITSVDFKESREHRFEIVVHVRSHKHNFKICFRTSVPDNENPVIDSLTPVYLGSSWTEREIFDMMGINFTDHPRMTRLLSPDDFEGHPLRKDFPVKGMHRGSFPHGMVINSKRREPAITKQTRPRPLDELLPRTPVEKRLTPIREEADKNA